jgi:hypothetical protein
MDEYSSRINTETPIFYKNFEELITASFNLINLTEEFYRLDTLAELEGAEDSIFRLILGTSEAIDGITGFYESIKEIPRIQKEMNVAKKNLLDTLEFLISKLKQSKILAEEYKSVIISKIDNLKIINNKQKLID